MTNSGNVEQRQPIERKKSTSQLGRGGIEQALKNALETGPAALGQQVRYILALSQMAAVPPVAEPPAEKVLTIAQARIATLTMIADSLNETQLKALIKEIRQINDSEARIQLLAQLTERVAPLGYRSLVRDLWNITRSFPNPITRARILLKTAPLIKTGYDEPAVSSALMEVIALAQSINNSEARIRSLVALAPHLPLSMCIRLVTRVLDDVDTINNDTLRCNVISAMIEPLPDEVEERALISAEGINAAPERARALTALAKNLPQHLQPRLRARTLEAIAGINNEDERAEALIAFAPNLETAAGKEEFPMLLAKALAIAVAMTRRHNRAKVLVALAPHLTLDLQGEALAAVHSLSSERDRAMLLAELAPTLPPEMLVASLAVAHTMREQDARVHALTILAHYVPSNARSQTLLDALAAASNLPHHYERVTALIALLDILPPQLQEQAYTNALETTRLIENENARARALSLLGQYLPEGLLERALEAAYKLRDSQQRLSALNGIVPYLSMEKREEALNRMLEGARQITVDYKRVRALVSIAPLLRQMGTELIEKALEISEMLEDPVDRVNAYVALAQNLPPDQRPPIINKAWALIKEIDDGYDRASALTAVAPFVPANARGELAQTAGMVIGSIMDEYDQASAISILAPLLAEGESAVTAAALPDYYAAVREALESALEVPQQALRAQLAVQAAQLWAAIDDSEQIYRLWVEIAPRLTSLPLADVLLCLAGIMPVLRLLTSTEGMIDIARILGVR